MAHRIIERLSASIPGDINRRNCSISLSIWSHLLHMCIPRRAGGSNELSVTHSSPGILEKVMELKADLPAAFRESRMKIASGLQTLHRAACRRTQKRRPLEIKRRRRPSSPGRVRVKSRQELVAALRAKVHHIGPWRDLKSDVIRMNRHRAPGYRLSKIPFAEPMHTPPDHAANLNLAAAVPARSATC